MKLRKIAALLLALLLPLSALSGCAQMEKGEEAECGFENFLDEVEEDGWLLVNEFDLEKKTATFDKNSREGSSGPFGFSAADWYGFGDMFFRDGFLYMTSYSPEQDFSVSSYRGAAPSERHYITYEITSNNTAVFTYLEKNSDPANVVIAERHCPEGSSSVILHLIMAGNNGTVYEALYVPSSCVDWSNSPEMTNENSTKTYHLK